MGRPADSLVYYASHDINIYFLRQLLRLNWLTESYNQNQVPPGAMLVFGLYAASELKTNAAHTAADQYFVKIYFMTQSMKQQRNLEELSDSNPASRVFAVIPGCAHGPELSCPFEDFKRLVLREVKRDC